MLDYRHKDLDVRAIGIGGIETVYILPRYHIAFDSGRCPFELIDIPRIFLTHGHLDHAAGLPYYLSQRSLRRLPPGEIYAPAETAPLIADILRIWQKIEGYEYPIRVHPLVPGDRIFLRENVFVEALRSFHRVPCNGYALRRIVRKLKPEFAGSAGEDIRKLRESGVPVTDDFEDTLFSFSGDSTIEFIEQNPIARTSRVLFLECTYIDSKRDVKRAREWGHIHLDEIAEKAGMFANERLVLTHFSRRYSPRQIRSLVEKALPQELAARTDLLIFD